MSSFTRGMLTGVGVLVVTGMVVRISWMVTDALSFWSGLALGAVIAGAGVFAVLMSQMRLWGR